MRWQLCITHGEVFTGLRRNSTGILTMARVRYSSIGLSGNAGIKTRNIAPKNLSEYIEKNWLADKTGLASFHQLAGNFCLG